MKKIMLVIAIPVMISMLYGHDIIPGVTRGTLSRQRVLSKESGPAPYYPATRQNELLFVEDPGNTVFGPAVKPDPNWQGVLDNVVGSGNYGWFGATIDTAQDGPDLTTMQQYPIVIWNCYDNWWANLRTNDLNNIESYISGGGKVWLIGQDLIYTAVPLPWLTANFHLLSYIEDYAWDDLSLAVLGLAEINGIGFTANADYQSNGFFCDELTPDANAHHILYDNTYLVYNSIAYPNTTPLSTSFWTSHGRGPNPAANWELMVQTMLQAFGWVGISEKPSDQKPVSFGFAPDLPVMVKGAVRVSYSLPVSGHVSIKVYDNTGRLISTLVDGIEESGTKNVSFNTDGIANGIYIFYLESENITDHHKLIIVH